MRYLIPALFLLVGCAKDDPSTFQYRYSVTCRDCVVGAWDPSTGLAAISDTLNTWEGTGVAEEGATLRLEAYGTRASDTASVVVIYVDGKQVEMDFAQPMNTARTHYYVH